MKYNLSQIMTRAWQIFGKGEGLSFAECLHRAWLSEKAQPVNAERIEAAKAAAGISEEVKTWSGWHKAGYMVKHGSKRLFSVSLIHGSKGDGQSYTASFFGASQTEPLTA